MTLVSGYTVAGLQAELDDLEAAITALVNAQHTSDLAAYSPIAEPVAVTVRGERISSVSGEVTNRNAAITTATNARVAAVSGMKPVTKSAIRSAGTAVTVNTNTTWMNVDTATDLVVPAAVGDLIEVSISAVWGVEAFGGLLDVVSIVGGSPVNSWALNAAPLAPSAPARGVQSWRGEASHNSVVSGSVARRLIAGDISGGNVTLRIQAALDAAGSKTLYGTVTNPLHFRATNYKQG